MIDGVDGNGRLNGLAEHMALPLIAAPMFLVSGPDLVLAACKSGVIGSFPLPNARTLETLDAWLGRIAGEIADARAADPDAKIASFAANMIVHSSYQRLDEELALLAEYKPDIVITALGSPKRVIDVVHGYGGRVIADVNSVPYARKAAAAGADGLCLVSAGAGGHTGHMAGFAFVPAVREFFDGIIVLSGSISTGGAIRAAELLGADLAYMGTPFIAANESLASDNYRDMLVAAEFEDLILSDALTGADAYYLRASLKAMGLDADALERREFKEFVRAEDEVKAWRDCWSAGHGVGTVRAIEPAAEIIARLKQEYAAAVARPHFGAIAE